MTLDQSARSKAAADALSAYDRHGWALNQERSRLASLRNIIETTPHIQIRLGERRMYGSAMEFNSRSLPGGHDILVSNAAPAPTDNVPYANERADAIVGPGLRACLLMWVAEQERDLRAATEAYRARDPIAEATAAADAVHG